MQTDSAVSHSLARLRELVTKARQRAVPHDADRDQTSSLSEPIVASADTPIARKRTRQLETLRQSHLALSRKVRELEDKAAGDASALLKHLSGFEGLQTQAQRALETSQMIQAGINVVSTLQSSAYGQPGSVLSNTNLLLAGNQLLWTYLDPIAKRLGLPVGPAPSALAHWAPLFSLVTARLMVGDRQHVRFISGIATFDDGDPVRLEGLRARIATGLWSDFQQRTDIAVTAQPLAPFRNVFVSADVHQGTLRLVATPRVRGAAGGLRVAWIVDTGDANG